MKARSSVLLTDTDVVILLDCLTDSIDVLGKYDDHSESYPNVALKRCIAHRVRLRDQLTEFLTKQSL